MQIMPANDASSASAFGFFDTSSSKGENFAFAMNDALDSVRDGNHFSATAAMNDGADQPRVETPYSRHTTDGVTYTLSEVCFTKAELKELRNQLVKEGAPEAALRQFDVLADQPDGATLAQVMASLMISGKDPQLSDGDVQAITTLLGQIDPSGKLATDALEFMRQGDGQAAMDLIRNALGNLDASDRIEIDAESVLALGRGLGLDESGQRSLLNNLGGRSTLSLDASRFDSLLGPAKSQLLEIAANAEKLDAALDKTLKPIISRARDRMEKEKAAASLEDRRVAHSRVLIDRTVQKNSRETIDATVTGQTETANEGKESAGAALKTPLNAEKITGDDADKAATARTDKAKAGENLSAHFKEVGAEGKAENDEKGSSLFDDSGLPNKDNKDAWSALLGKIETRPQAAAANAAAPVYAVHVPEAETPLINPEALLSAPQLPSFVGAQVESGLLTAMRDGATRLDLQLHPAELGTISITLVARNGELTAQIRSEKSETADALTRQLDTIRVNLEQQGVKVDKIEVELQNHAETGRDDLQDLNQHNSWQEANSRRQELNRIRNLSALRNLDRDNSATLAQSVHNIGQSAKIAAQGLHVVA